MVVVVVVVTGTPYIASGGRWSLVTAAVQVQVRAVVVNVDEKEGPCFLVTVFQINSHGKGSPAL